MELTVGKMKQFAKPRKTAKRVKMSRSDKIYNVIGTIAFSILALICAYPFYYILICTISDNRLVALQRIIFLPKGIHFDNYIKVFKIQNLANSAGITIARTVLGTALSLMATSYMAYFFTKEEMWARKFWYRFMAVTMYFSAGLIPGYLNNKMLGLTNTFWIYVIPGMVSVYNMILIKTSVEALPAELEESAYLDGAGYFTRFIRIVLPLQKPILATAALFAAVGHWNDYFTTKMYVTKPTLYTMQFQLYELLNQINSAAEQISQEDPSAALTPTGIRLTLTAVVVIPILFVYPFVQKYFVKGIMMGAVKG